MVRTRNVACALVGALSLLLTSAAMAHAPSGAIFTTVADGTEVNFNQYPAKTDVYLDGGPGPGAPQHAAGLDDGVYVFQVTDPSGKVLLSTDKAKFRQFTVTNGIISGVAPGTHVTGLDVDHGATTVQLYPFKDTPNPGGVYKVWVVRVEDFLLGCQQRGFAGTDGLERVDVGVKGDNKHGFIPAHCKTDNFKVKESLVVEIDTRFHDRATGETLDGCQVTWVDTNGASNKKHSYFSQKLNVNHEAHVESIEPGTHTIIIGEQAGFTINQIKCPDGTRIYGPGQVKVTIPAERANLTVFIDVYVDRN
jgi:hypothetical protein